MTTNSMPRPLQGRVAVVTGAGAGIGRAEALQLAQAGAHVVLNDLRGEHVERVADEVRAAGGEVAVHVGSMTSVEQAQALVDLATRTFGRLDILVNNAGAVRWTPLGDMTEKQWDIVTDVSLRGYFATIHCAAPVMQAQRSGVIINTSSESGLGAGYMASYSAAKEGVIGLTRAAAYELGPFNVRCNAIRPRAFDTTASPAAYRRYLDMEARFGRPATGNHSMAHTIFPKAEEVGAIVTWLCTDDAAQVSGRTFLIGGGEVALMSEPQVVRTCFNPDGWTLDALPRIKAALLGGLKAADATVPPEAHAILQSREGL